MGKTCVFLCTGISASGVSACFGKYNPGPQHASGTQKRIQSDRKLADFILREGITSFVDYWESIPLFATQLSLPDSVKASIRVGRLKNNPSDLQEACSEWGRAHSLPGGRHYTASRRPSCSYAVNGMKSFALLIKRCITCSHQVK